MDESLRQPDALPEAFGKLADVFLDFTAEAAHLNHVGDAAHPLRLGDSTELGDEQKVIHNAHVHIEGRVLGQIADHLADFEGMLAYVEVIDNHIALIRAEIAGDDLHGRGLACAVRAEEPENFPILHGERNIIDRESFPETL